MMHLFVSNGVKILEHLSKLKGYYSFIFVTKGTIKVH